jgi:hypothetical protein
MIISKTVTACIGNTKAVYARWRELSQRVKDKQHTPSNRLEKTKALLFIHTIGFYF